MEELSKKVFFPILSINQAYAWRLILVRLGASLGSLLILKCLDEMHE